MPWFEPWGGRLLRGDRADPGGRALGQRVRFRLRRLLHPRPHRLHLPRRKDRGRLRRQGRRGRKMNLFSALCLNIFILSVAKYANP